MLLGRSALWLLAQIPPGREKVAALTELWHNYLRGRRGHSRTAQTSWCWRADSKCCSCLAEWLSWLERFLMCRSWGCAPQARHVQESARDISTKTTAVGPPPPHHLASRSQSQQAVGQLGAYSAVQQQRWSEAGLGAVGGRGPVLSGFHPRGDTQLALPSVNLQRLGAAGAGNAP